MKKLIWLVATSPPMQLNIGGVSRDLGVSRPTIYTYLEVLERAGLLLSVLPRGDGARLVRKDSKLFLENTNLLWGISQSLARTDPLGSLRETFFANQIVSAGLRVRLASKGDFVVEDRYTFEVGGRTKTAGQVAGVPEAYVVQDGRESGSGQVLPLWLFGFLY
jgi:predicted AAA+ superfamily ATPase